MSKQWVILCGAADDEQLERLIDAVDRLSAHAVAVEGYHNGGRLRGRAQELAVSHTEIPMVIVDEQLRDERGTETLMALREHGLGAGMVLLISGGDPDELGAALRAGALDATLSKPFGEEQLSITMHRLVTEFFIEHDPTVLERFPQLVDIQVLSHALTVAEQRLDSTEDQIRTLQQSFLADRSLSDDEVEQAMIDEIDRVLGRPQREVHPPGRLLLQEGQAVDGIQIVVSGRVRLYRVINRQEAVFFSRTAGRVIGLFAMARNQPAAFSVEAVDEVTTLPLSLGQLDTALRHSSTLAVHFVAVLIRAMARRNLRSVELRQQINNLNQDLAAERDQARDMLQQLELAQRRLVETEKMATLGQLVAGIGHELNNPIAAISRAGEFLRQDVEALLAQRPDGQMMSEALEASLAAPPLSTREERERRRRLTEQFGDEDLARRLVRIGIETEADYEATFAGLDDAQAAQRLEALETAHRMGRSLRNVRSSAERVEALVQSLRSYSRPSGDSFTPVDVEEGLEETLLLVGHELREVAVDTDYGGVAPVLGNAGHLNQVWTNLIVNALQAMEGEGTLTVRTRQPRPDQIEVQIADTGPGIPPEDVDRIFSLEFTTKKGRVEFGLGLGLRIVADVVERHGGEISVTSRPGDTVFTVTLPAAEQLQ